MRHSIARALGTAALALGVVVGGSGGASASTINPIGYGDKGSGVTCIEQMLKVVGAPEIIVDSYFGLWTELRVKDAQKFFHLPGVTLGVVDDQTGELLFYIAAMREAHFLFDPFDIWNPNRAAQCKPLVPHNGA